MDVEGGQERGAGVPDIVHTDARDTRSAAVAFEGRLKFRGSIGVPVGVVNVKSEVFHSSPATFRASSWTR
ncbi:hypothetical protein ACFQQB_25150 [Nonomuraea rubra]|uniref:hypothetical protein n=1 Tax=Nonomuraea rubra TaxID=46180 RepID=UPI0033832DD9